MEIKISILKKIQVLPHQVKDLIFEQEWWEELIIGFNEVCSVLGR